MSRRPKAAASVDMSGLSDEQLRAELKGFGLNPVITDTTRGLMVKKLEKLRKESKSACPVPAAVNGSNKQTGETSVMRVVATTNKSRPSTTVTSFSSDEESADTTGKQRVIRTSEVKKRVVVSPPKRSPTVVPDSPVKPKSSGNVTTPRVNLFFTPSNTTEKSSPLPRGFEFSDTEEGQIQVDDEEEDEQSEEEMDTYEVVNRSMNTSFAPSVINTSINVPSGVNRWDVKDSRPSVDPPTPTYQYRPTPPSITSRFTSVLPPRFPDTPRPDVSSSASVTSRFSTSDIYERHNYSRPTAYTTAKPIFSIPETTNTPYSSSSFLTNRGIKASNICPSTTSFLPPRPNLAVKKRQPGYWERTSNSLKSLNKYRRDTYKKLADRFYQLWGGSEEDGDDDDTDDDRRFQPRYSHTPYEGKQHSRAARFQWPKVTEGAIMYSFWGFLALIAVMYAATVHSDKLHVVHGVAIDSVIFIYENLIFPLLGILLVVGVIVGAYSYQRYRWHKQAEEQRQVYEMVESIITTVREHHDDRVASGEKDPFLAIVHARDHLIPPSMRKTLGPIWDKAVEYLQQNESRLRQENQCISGEDFMVWRWLQTTAPIKGKGWQGLAFPEEQIPLNGPRYPYTSCLKARGLFDPDKETGINWPLEIRRAIRAKIKPVVEMADIRVDPHSKEGCVFIKCATNEEAGKVYKVLHGNWFNGHLVSVKYIKPERFSARFPDAKDS